MMINWIQFPNEFCGRIHLAVHTLIIKILTKALKNMADIFKFNFHFLFFSGAEAAEADDSSRTATTALNTEEAAAAAAEVKKKLSQWLGAMDSR